MKSKGEGLCSKIKIKQILSKIVTSIVSFIYNAGPTVLTVSNGINRCTSMAGLDFFEMG